jgi:HD-GYP domain-containing protein (c-di-GMP phosphodiesterase class II)
VDELKRYIRTNHRSSELMQMDPKDIAIKLCLDPEDIKEINKTFHNSFEFIKKTEGHLNCIIDSISAENKYQRKNIILTSYLAITVVKKMSWYQESLIEKIVFACIFHDLLGEKEKLAMILEKDFINSNVLSAKEIKVVKNHAHDIAEKIERISEVPSDVIHILRDHHERPDGGGFPRGIGNSRLKPLTALFIVAEFASNFLLTESLTHMETLHMDLEKKFMGHSNFEKVTRELIKILQEKLN